LLFFLVLRFSLTDFLLFYLSFECSLIPILFLILGWGYQIERVQAGIYIMFYTLFASLPLLFLFFVSYSQAGGRYMYFGFLEINLYLYIFFSFAFLVKFPIYIFHL